VSLKEHEDLGTAVNADAPNTKERVTKECIVANVRDLNESDLQCAEKRFYAYRSRRGAEIFIYLDTNLT
jgi:hypothetical protein